MLADASFLSAKSLLTGFSPIDPWAPNEALGAPGSFLLPAQLLSQSFTSSIAARYLHD